MQQEFTLHCYAIRFTNTLHADHMQQECQYDSSGDSMVLPVQNDHCMVAQMLIGLQANPSQGLQHRQPQLRHKHLHSRQKRMFNKRDT